MDEHPQRDPSFMSTLRRLLEMGREQSIEPTGEAPSRSIPAADTAKNSNCDFQQ